MDKFVNPEIRIFPARYGISWLVQSLALIRAQPARLLFLAVMLQLILGLTRLPLIGLFIVIAMPALSAGLLQAFRLVAAGQRPLTVTLFAPLAAGPRTGRLLLLGVLLFAIGILSVSLLLTGSESMIDPELLARIEQGDMDALAAIDPQLILQIGMAMVVGVSLSGTLSFMAIPLLWFHDQKLSAALISGIKALFLNWRPFTVLALGLAILLVPVVLIVAILFQVAGTAGIFSVVLIGLVMVIALAFQLAIFGTQYCSFRDIYALDSIEPEAGAGDISDSQLLA